MSPEIEQTLSLITASVTDIRPDTNTPPSTETCDPRRVSPVTVKVFPTDKQPPVPTADPTDIDPARDMSDPPNTGPLMEAGPYILVPRATCRESSAADVVIDTESMHAPDAIES